MAATMTAVCSGGLLGSRAAAPRSTLGPDGEVYERDGTWFHRLSHGSRLTEAERRAAFLRAQARYLAAQPPARRAALTAEITAAVARLAARDARSGTPARPSAQAPAHPVLYGVAALTGVRSARTDPSTPYVSSYHLRFARGAFGAEPGLGVTRTAWLSTGYDKWESVGIPRFTAQGSFLRFELPCVTQRSKDLAAHVRSGGQLQAIVDFASVAEHTEGRTRVVDRARACGVLLTVGPGSTGFPLSMVEVRG